MEIAQHQGSKIAENLKNDRVRALRSFKFTLVEYLKNLLKPYWKQGRLSKDAHKMIVKKSVNKVISSFQGSEIPSGRKTNHYLECSHMKLSKLIQGVGTACIHGRELVETIVSHASN